MKNSPTEPLSIRQNTLWNSAGNFFYLGCQWVTTVLVVLLSSNYTNSGILAFAMAAGILFSCIALFSIRTYQVSDLNDKYSSQNYVAFRLITNLAGALVCIVYLLAITPDLTLIATSIVYFLFKADETFSDVLYGIEQKNSRMDYIGKSQFARGVLSIVGFTVPLALGSSLYLAIISMALLCMLVTVFYDVSHAKLFGKITPSLSFAKAKSLIVTCFPAMLATVFASAITTVVRQYFGIAYGEEMLGIYAAIATPAVLIQVTATYLYSPWIGELAKANQNSTEAFLKLFLRISGILILAIIILILALIPLGTWFLELMYGPSIVDYLGVFPFAIAATGCVGFLFFMNSVFVILRKFAPMLIFNALGLLCSIGSSFYLISVFSMNGINYAIILGCLLGISISFAGVIYHCKR